MEITSQKELKVKEKELQKLQRRVRHLEEVAKRLEANQIPPLDLPETSATEVSLSFIIARPPTAVSYSNAVLS